MNKWKKSRSSGKKSLFGKSGRDYQEVYYDDDDAYDDADPDVESETYASPYVDRYSHQVPIDRDEQIEDLSSSMPLDLDRTANGVADDGMYDEDEIRGGTYEDDWNSRGTDYTDRGYGDMWYSDAPTHTKVRRRHSLKDVVITVLTVAVSVLLIFALVFNAPIIRYEKTEGNTTTVQQVSILKYWKLWQPLVEQEGELSKSGKDDSADLNLKSDLDEDYDDGLDLDQIIEGQYTILFLGMDESGELSDVNWIFQFDLIAGTLNILQIPRDSYMPDYASYSTMKFNSIYHSGQESGVTPIQRVVNAVEESFCMYIDCYIKLDCEDIANIVDSVGGIPITLPEEIVYEADKVLPAGEQVLDGEQSEWFIRFRHGYDEGDIGRVKAQRIFLAAAMEKMLDMSTTTLYAAMSEIYTNQWIATDLSLEQISMLADYASNRLTLDSVNIFMVPGEGANYYPGDGTVQSVYSIHKSTTIDLLNTYFRPYQNEIYSEESTIVELVPEGEYQATAYDDTQENLEDISDGDTDDGEQS